MHSRYELNALTEFLSTVQGHVSAIEDELPVHLANRINQAQATADEGEMSVAWQEVSDITENILPRFYLNLAAIAIYSTFEFCINDIVKFFERKHQPGITFHDLTGRSFLDHVRKYFLHVVGVPTFSANVHWEALTNLADVRNCIVHAQGKISFMTPGAQRRLENLMRANRGLTQSDWDEMLMVQAPFLARSQAAVEVVVRHLIEETRMVLDSVTGSQTDSD